MANQLKMADVQALLALHQRGWSQRRIARELAIDRETVGRHIRLAQAAANPASAPSGSGDVQAGTDGSNAASAPSGSPGALSTSTSAAWPFRTVILEKLAQGLQAQRIYQDLVAPGHGYAGSYYSVRRLVKKLTAASEPPVRRMECDPGAEAQVDFGRGAPVVDAQGKRRGTWVFRIVLSHSRKGYSEAVYRQTTDEFLRCLENAFAYFGGVAQTLVIDNLRAAVSRADWFDPELCPKVRSFAEHYGIAILPTRPYTPRHKGKIENGIKYVKNNALKARSFTSLADQNRHLLEWEQAVADTRIHGTTRQQVGKLFLEAEKAALAALPTGRFDLFSEALRRVHRDGHVQVQGAYYSVGPEYLGCEVWARWDGRLVRLFDQRMQPIAVHAQQSPGRFSTHDAHIRPEKISGIERGTGWLLGQVDMIGPEAKTWAEAMLAQRGIAGVRVLMGLLSLRNSQSSLRIEEACRVAASHGAYHLGNLRRLIAARESAPAQESFAFAESHPIIRPLADYAQWLRETLTHQPSITKESA
ncbi:MAG: IS21 family transposase [Anaerolineae bacterium]|nr:IS21 family transposase [Anaerolineae bacterium]